MRALHVASEVFPLAKTGGLADVAAALPAALSRLDIDARLLIPGYTQAIERTENPRQVAQFNGLLGCETVHLLSARLPDTGLPVWLVDCPDLYDRRGGIYQNEAGQDWHDNALRFALLNHVAALVADGAADTDWRPDIVHAHDWHAGLVPMLVSKHSGPRPASVLTIHNLAYQGLFAAEAARKLGLPDDPAVHSSIEFYGQLSFLKAGIGWADALTTVSPTYSREILTPEYGCGLDGLLRERAARLSGIMNGADYGIWDPANDSHLETTYSSHRPSPKRKCKTVVQMELGLEPSADTPLFALMSRLAHQKMPDVVLAALPALLAEKIQFALVADGDAGYANRFRELAASYPGQVSVRIGYEESLAHRILAGADILLHPSRYEPCGLTPIYAMRYGTLPIVRRCGGLADSVIDANPTNLKSDIATGFSFNDVTVDDLTKCMQRAVSIYRQPIAWRKIRSSAMRQDFGWRHSAQTHVDLYRTLVSAPAEVVAIERQGTRDKLIA